MRSVSGHSAFVQILVKFIKISLIINEEIYSNFTKSVMMIPYKSVCLHKFFPTEAFSSSQDRIRVISFSQVEIQSSLTLVRTQMMEAVHSLYLLLAMICMFSTVSSSLSCFVDATKKLPASRKPLSSAREVSTGVNGKS